MGGCASKPSAYDGKSPEEDSTEPYQPPPSAPAPAPAPPQPAPESTDAVVQPNANKAAADVPTVQLAVEPCQKEDGKKKPSAGDEQPRAPADVEELQLDAPSTITMEKETAAEPPVATKSSEDVDTKDSFDSVKSADFTVKNEVKEAVAAAGSSSSTANSDDTTNEEKERALLQTPAAAQAANDVKEFNNANKGIDGGNNEPKDRAFDPSVGEQMKDAEERTVASPATEEAKEKNSDQNDRAFDLPVPERMPNMEEDIAIVLPATAGAEEKEDQKDGAFAPPASEQTKNEEEETAAVPSIAGAKETDVEQKDRAFDPSVPEQFQEEMTTAPPPVEAAAETAKIVTDSSNSKTEKDAAMNSSPDGTGISGEARDEKDEIVARVKPAADGEDRKLPKALSRVRSLAKGKSSEEEEAVPDSPQIVARVKTIAMNFDHAEAEKKKTVESSPVAIARVPNADGKIQPLSRVRSLKRDQEDQEAVPESPGIVARVKSMAMAEANSDDAARGGCTAVKKLKGDSFSGSVQRAGPAGVPAITRM